MDGLSFDMPVAIAAGLGMPVHIGTVMEAYIFLNEQPAGRHSAARDLALKACRAGLAGEIDAETVRAAFVAYARRSHLLLPDAVAIARLPAVRGANA